MLGSVITDAAGPADRNTAQHTCTAKAGDTSTGFRTTIAAFATIKVGFFQSNIIAAYVASAATI